MNAREAPAAAPGAAAAPRETLADFLLAPGFEAAAAACGLKESGALDLAVIRARAGCAAAGLFTTNRVQAAPVLHDRAVLERSAAEIRLVVANAGCANACTGEPGLEDARATAAAAAARLGCRPDQVLLLSTGVIGRRLDVVRVRAGIDAVAAALESGAPSGAAEAARAILTTDTRAKVAALDVAHASGAWTLRGMAKGSGMIHPDLATMLAVVTTDARLPPPALDRLLRDAAAASFNRVSVDGDTSTNDTVLLLASGAAGTTPAGADLERFAAGLTAVCASLARQIARDGEGATRLVEIRVTGAADPDQAHRVAGRIAASPLVKTAIHGGDPNWGRILAAAGASGAAIDPARLTLEVGGAAPVRLVERGLPVAADPEAAAARLREDPVIVALDLGLGRAASTMWTCDLSAEYVAINAHYTT